MAANTISDAISACQQLTRHYADADAFLTVEERAGHRVDISVGKGNLGQVTLRRTNWYRFTEKLAKAERGTESAAEYRAMTPEQRGAEKARAGFYIGAVYRSEQRKTQDIENYTLLALDADKANADFCDRLKSGKLAISQYEFIAHTTRSHTPEAPRWRIVLPLDRAVTSCEFRSLARYVTYLIDPGLNVLDKASFRPGQIAFFPSVSKDGQFQTHLNFGAFLPADATLARIREEFGDQQDARNWPGAGIWDDAHQTEHGRKAADPRAKVGWIGAFCRVYDVHGAISKFLPEVYEPGEVCSGKPRYTYMAGSAANGAIVQDDGLFLYSHHGTDPVSERLVNSFDLVRLHKFGELDCNPDRDAKPSSLPSWEKMIELCKADPAVVADYHEHEASAVDPDMVFEDLNATEGDTDDTILQSPEASADEKIDALNRRHAVIVMGGNVRVLYEKPGVMEEYWKLEAFRENYKPHKVEIPDGKGSAKTKWIALTQHWEHSPRRRAFPDGVDFRPGGRVGRGTYNLWRGFSVEPDQSGSCRRYKDHLRSNICQGNDQHYRWLWSWMAHLIQRPHEKPQTAIVLRGLKGVGKSKFGEILGKLVMWHYALFSKPEHILGHFNSPLRNKILIDLDEAVWPGDHAHESVLKNLITAPTIQIEPKGVDAFEINSAHRIIFSSNADWTVPASFDERRFAVFDVSARRMKDYEYFGALDAEMQNGGFRRLMHELLTTDLKGFNPREAPATDGLLHQKLVSANSFAKWWYDELRTGGRWPADGAAIEEGRDALRNAFERFARGQREYKEMTPDAFGKALMKCCRVLTHRPRTEGSRIRTYSLPPLAECREAFERLIGHAINWSEASEL